MTGGCGGMGGAQPLAVTLNGGVCLIVDVDGTALHRRVEQRYLDVVADDLDDAIALATAREARRARCRSASSATPRRSLPSCCAAASPSTSSPTRPPRTTRCRYLPDRRRRSPTGRDYAAAKPEEFTDRARESMARHVEAMVGFQDAGAEVFDYGNSIRDEARQGGYDRAFDFPGFVPAYIRPLFCEGKGPFRWAALSGDPHDIARHRPGRARPVPRERPPAPLDPRGAGAGRVPGAAGAHLLARATASATAPGCGSTSSSRRGEVSAPLVIGRDHLDAGSVASPYRETEGMADGSDAIADWPLLNALVDTRRPAPPGCRSTTAAASASAARSTPGR